MNIIKTGQFTSGQFSKRMYCYMHNRCTSHFAKRLYTCVYFIRCVGKLCMDQLRTNNALKLSNNTRYSPVNNGFGK